MFALTFLTIIVLGFFLFVYAVATAPDEPEEPFAPPSMKQG